MCSLPPHPPTAARTKIEATAARPRFSMWTIYIKNNATGSRAGHPDGSFIRMRRIFRITRMDFRGGWVRSPESFSFFCYFAREARLADRSLPSGSSQKIPALLLRVLTPRGAIRVIRSIRLIRMKLPSEWPASVRP